jgi:SAM-dependent methyltransferase
LIRVKRGEGEKVFFMNMDRFEWRREQPFLTGERAAERWILREGGHSHVFEVDVRFGKDLDIARIKKDWPFEREIALTREKMNYFERESDFVQTEQCPVCRSEKERARPFVRVCGLDYLQCGVCSHVYADRFPGPKVLEKFYQEHAVEDDYYLNPQEIELRLQEVYLPKLGWILEVYEKIFGTRPRSILDIGAGSGHFLYGCKQAGLDVAGIEPDRGFVRWCLKQFGIPLAEEKAAVGDRRFDVVCSFNVIELTFLPGEFLSECREFMHERSLLVVETPKVNCLTTAIQGIYPNEPRGHLVPYEHNHLFTDSSLATLLFKAGFGIRSAWFFGQDMSELMLRVCAELKGESGSIIARCYGPLQKTLDAGHGSDLMLLAAVAR